MLLGAFIYTLRIEESYSTINKAWKVKNLTMNDQHIENQFKSLRFNILDNGSILLPLKEGRSLSGWPIKYSTYKYKRKDFLTDKLRSQMKFSRYFAYDIEILSHNKPLTIRVFNDSIAFKLEELMFSIDNTTLPME